jgi:hypothetical protein
MVIISSTISGGGSATAKVRTACGLGHIRQHEPQMVAAPHRSTGNRGVASGMRIDDVQISV